MGLYISHRMNCHRVTKVVVRQPRQLSTGWTTTIEITHNDGQEFAFEMFHPGERPAEFIVEPTLSEEKAMDEWTVETYKRFHQEEEDSVQYGQDPNPTEAEVPW